MKKILARYVIRTEFFLYITIPLTQPQNPREMEKWTLHFLISFLFLSLSGKTQAWENYRTSARSAALGYASAALGGSEALFHNQAGIINVNAFSMVFSGQSKFLLKELSLLSAGLVLPTPAGTIGGQITRFGTGTWHQDKFGVTYARKLGHRFSASVTFDYLSERLPENDRSFSVITCEAGVLFSMNEKWSAGVHVFNPPGVKMNGPAGNQKVALEVMTGIAWHISPYLTSFHEMDFSSLNPPALHTGIEFTPFPGIAFRAGISGGPPEFSIGAGFRMGWMEFDVAFSCHAFLGITPVAGIMMKP
jgi:hypothetical protein